MSTATSNEAWLSVTVLIWFTGTFFSMPLLPLYLRQLGGLDAPTPALWSGLIFGPTPLVFGWVARSGDCWPTAAVSVSIAAKTPPERCSFALGIIGSRSSFGASASFILAGVLSSNSLSPIFPMNAVLNATAVTLMFWTRRWREPA